MAFCQLPLPQRRQHRVAVAQQTQLVGHGALALPQQPGGLLLAHLVFLQQMADAQSFLDEIQILPLEILHHGCHAGFPGVHLHDNAGHLGKPRDLCRPEPPFSGNQLIAPGNPADGQGLQNPMAGDGVSQLLQRLRLEYLPGLAWVGADGAHREKYHPAGFHIGFQLLALHCPSSLVNTASIVSIRERETPRNRQGKEGNSTTVLPIIDRAAFSGYTDDRNEVLL